MKERRIGELISGLIFGSIFLVLFQSFGATLKATYEFQGTLNAEQAGVPPVISVDPLGLNHFETAIVFGQTRQVYRFDGNQEPVEQEAGLVLNATGLIPPDHYSIELIFEYVNLNTTWRKIVDVNNRGSVFDVTSDTGFYVSPTARYGGGLQLYIVRGSIVTGPTFFTTNEFHHVVLTVDPSGEVRAYLDGLWELSTNTTAMNINNTLNPNNLINFFLDDFWTAWEYADARITLLRLYEGVLTPNEVTALAASPFTIEVTVVKPDGSAQIVINPDFQGKFSLAILSTDNFDATKVDPGQTNFAGAGVNLKANGTYQFSFQDVNGDGWYDIVMHLVSEFDIAAGSTTAELTGKTVDGKNIHATVPITTVPPIK